MHLGHRRILDTVQASGLRSLVVTFEPHPRTVRGNRVELLCTTERRLELLERAGIDDVLLLHFDDTLGTLAPEAFAETVLRASGVEVVVEGDGFRFGSKRSGDLDLLARLGFDVRRVTLVDEISSTRIRRLISTGEIVDAAALLGRPVELQGIVVLGDQRGGTLGFPTANIAPSGDMVVPGHGVYAAFANGLPSAVNVGVRPTFETGRGLLVETYIIDQDIDLYGQVLRVAFIARLRGERRFPGAEDLIAQMHLDVEEARKLCASFTPPR